MSSSPYRDAPIVERTIAAEPLFTFYLWLFWLGDVAFVLLVFFGGSPWQVRGLLVALAATVLGVALVARRLALRTRFRLMLQGVSFRIDRIDGRGVETGEWLDVASGVLVTTELVKTLGEFEAVVVIGANKRWRVGPGLRVDDVTGFLREQGVTVNESADDLLAPTAERWERPGPSGVAIRRLEPDEWRTYRDLRLRALRDAPDAFGRTLHEEKARTDAEWLARLAAPRESDLPLVALAGTVPVGLAWGRIDPNAPETAHLHQMWVAPNHRRRGVGETLLAAVIDWAESRRARFLELVVTTGDTPATRLCSRAGFEPIGEATPHRNGSEVSAQAMRLSLEP